jgi:hypothetical protein
MYCRNVVVNCNVAKPHLLMRLRLRDKQITRLQLRRNKNFTAPAYTSTVFLAFIVQNSNIVSFSWVPALASARKMIRLQAPPTSQLLPNGSAGTGSDFPYRKCF